MSTIAELTIPASEFALQATIDATDDLDIETERVVASNPDHVLPYVWFVGETSTLESVDDLLADDDSVESFELVAELDSERLYRVDWVDDVTLVVRLLTEAQATVLDATVEGHHWRFRVLVPERESLSTSYDFAAEQGVSLEVQKIHSVESESRRGRYGLTDAQYETLVAALTTGYYEIPRGMDMEELSNELEISHQALSERLRRAHRALVTEAVDTSDHEQPADEQQ